MNSLVGESVLVTGSTGFLGRALARRLVAEGARVRAMVRSAEKVGRLPGEVEVAMGDIREPGSLTGAAAGCGVVFHCAASLGGNLTHQLQVNSDGTEHVATAAAEAGSRRLVHVSSIAVYGFAHTSDITEATEAAPSRQAYSLSKAESERRVRVPRGDLEWTIIRPGGIFGPEARYWTAGYFKRARRRPVVFLGRGNGAMPVVFVDDVVDMVVRLAVHPAAAGEAFNCVIDPSPTVREYFNTYSRLVGHESWMGVPMPLARAGARIAAIVARPNTYLKEAPMMVGYIDRFVRYRMDKAREVLGWEPRFDLESGVAACVPWLRAEGLLGRRYS